MSFLDANRKDVCSEIGQPGSVNTTIELKELRFGSYNVPVVSCSVVSITHLGIKFSVSHCVHKTQKVALNIQKSDIMKFIVHYGSQLPVVFLYTTPGCGRYIRRSLGMSSVFAAPPANSSASLPPYYDPTNCTEQVKRIVFVATDIRDDSKNAIKVVFPRIMYDEISFRDALDLLNKSRGCASGSGRESLGSSSPGASERLGGANKRSAAMVARATIKRVADHSAGQNASSLGSSQPMDPQDIHKLMIYPPVGKGGISINTEDYQCLAVDQYLNDVIIDFYLRYLFEEVMTPEQRQKTHIFSSFFYKRLTATSARQRHLERDLKMTAAQKRHNRVKSWTKNVNLFEKDFIVIPINELSHWFLAVICFPGLKGPRNARTGEELSASQAKANSQKAASQLTKKAVADMEKRKSGLMSVTIGNTTITPVGKGTGGENIYVNEETLSERDEAEGDENEMMSEDEDTDTEAKGNGSQAASQEPIVQPCILVFDSLRGTARSRVTATLREYLTCEYLAKGGDAAPKKVFDKDLMPGHNARVPQQNNFTDCGLFVLQYVEEMIKNPIVDFRLPIHQLKTWFSIQKVTRKREDIALLIRQLLEKEHADRIGLLPEIDFPTVNGEPVADDQEQESPEKLEKVPTPPVPSNDDMDGADSEDLFDDIGDVMDQGEEEEEAAGAKATPPGSQEKKKKLITIPNISKRKSTIFESEASSATGTGETSAKKAARIS